MQSTELIPLEEPLEKWHIVAYLTPGLFMRMLASYAPALPDQTTWQAWLDNLNRALIFVHEDGFLFVENIVPNASAEIHGAKWHDREHAAPSEDVRPLLKSLFERLGVSVLNAPIPSTNSPAIAWAQKYGFQTSGAIPFRLTYDGIPTSIVNYSLYREA